MLWPHLISSYVLFPLPLLTNIFKSLNYLLLSLPFLRCVLWIPSFLFHGHILFIRPVWWSFFYFPLFHGIVGHQIDILVALFSISGRNSSTKSFYRRKRSKIYFWFQNHYDLRNVPNFLEISNIQNIFDSFNAVSRKHFKCFTDE